MLIAAVIIALLVAMKMQSNIASAPLNEVSSGAAEDSAGTNILVLGSDSRTLTTGGYGQDDGTERSDSMMLVHMSADKSRIDAVQIPRDTLTDIPPCPDSGRGAYPGGRDMINSALNFGPSCSVAAVEALSNVPIDHFVVINFEGFANIIDALGGVPVDLPAPLKDPKAKLDLPAGEQVLNGKDALAWARVRHAIGDGSDIARLGHQQEVVNVIAETIRDQNFVLRPDRLYNFLDAATKSVLVDEGIDSVPALAALGLSLSGVEEKDRTIVTMPWQPAPENPNRVVPTLEAVDYFNAMINDVPLPESAE